jgi:carbon catabolite-derepressing protein kinase
MLLRLTVTALLTNDKNLQPFFAQSPPTHTDSYLSRAIPNTLSGMTRPQIIPPPSSEHERARQGSNASSQLASVRSPVSTVAILPSSVPEYHKAYMKGQPRASSKPQDNEGFPPTPEQTEEQRQISARRLKPNFRAIPDANRQRPEPMTSLPAKKPRPTKWQFGIRSRNQPAEAMLAIFKALKAMGADWEVPKIRKAGGRSGSRSQSASPDQSRSTSRSHSRGSSISSHSSPEEEGDRPGSPHREPLTVRNGDDGEQETRGRQKRHYNHTNDWGYYVPEDPWVINARFRKDGMFPPGVAHPSSTHSSRVDLVNDPTGLRRRSSTNTSTSSLNHGVEGLTMSDRQSDEDYPHPDEAVWIYMSIQLYSIDRDFFVVDFKCAGYERLVSNLVREIKATSTSNTSMSNLALSSSQPHHQHQDGWDDEQGVWRRLGEGEPLPDDLAKELRDGGTSVLRERTEEVGVGRKDGEKIVTSPFPFLDVASTLILQLSGE